MSFSNSSVHSCAVFYNSPRIINFDEARSLVFQLYNVSVFLSQSITKTMTISQIPQYLTVQKKARLHMLPTADGLRLYIPAEESQRTIALAQALPRAMCRIMWIFHPDALAVVASILHLKNDSAIDAVLEEAGVASLPSANVKDFEEWKEEIDDNKISEAATSSATGTGSRSSETKVDASGDDEMLRSEDQEDEDAIGSGHDDESGEDSNEEYDDSRTSESTQLAVTIAVPVSKAPGTVRDDGGPRNMHSPRVDSDCSQWSSTRSIQSADTETTRPLPYKNLLKRIYDVAKEFRIPDSQAEPHGRLVDKELHARIQKLFDKNDNSRYRRIGAAGEYFVSVVQRLSSILTSPARSVWYYENCSLISDSGLIGRAFFATKS